LAFLYQHIRLDTQTVFYVGIAKNISRAYSKHNRNDHWRKIVNKVGYRVELLLENISYDEARRREISMIRLWGRDDIGTGPLVNMTDGGDGMENLSKESIAKAHTPEIIARRSKTRKKPVLQYSKSGKLIKEWESASDANIYFRGFDSVDSRITRCCRGKTPAVYGYVWRYKSPELWFEPSYDNKWYDKEFTKQRSQSQKNPIKQYSLSGEFIKEWTSASDVEVELDISASTILKCCRGKEKSFKKYLWRYSDPLKWFPPSYTETNYHSEAYKNGHKVKMKPVLQYSITGDYIKEWNSMAEVKKELNFHTSAIIKSCKGEYKQAYGYVWKYKNKII